MKDTIKKKSLRRLEGTDMVNMHVFSALVGRTLPRNQRDGCLGQAEDK